MDTLRTAIDAWIERRWLQVALGVLLLLALAPTPRPAGVVAAVRQGATALGAGEPGEALARFEQALEMEPGWMPVRQLAARAAIAAGDRGAAAQHLSRLDPAARNHAAIGCYKAFRGLSAAPSGPALDSALRSVLSCPGYSAALESQAAEWTASGKVESAEDLARAWTEAVPQEALAWNLLGRSVATRNPAHAIPALERSMALDPAAGQRLLPLLTAARASEDQAAGVAEVGRVYLQQEEWALAAVALERAVVLAPEQARTRAYLGLARERSGGDGLPEITAALAMRPNDPSILILHASLLRARGRLDEAVSEALTAIQLEPSDPAIAAELAAAYADQGDLTSAASAYKQAARLTSDRPEFWLLLARFSADYAVDEQGLGLPASRNAVALRDGDANAWQTLGQLHFQLGNQILADRMLRRALALAPRLPESWYDFGLIRLALDDRSGAQQALHAVLALDPAGPWADLAQRALTGASLP